LERALWRQCLRRAVVHRRQGLAVSRWAATTRSARCSPTSTAGSSKASIPPT
jgi:hypothetical protein